MRPRMLSNNAINTNRTMTPAKATCTESLASRSGRKPLKDLGLILLVKVQYSLVPIMLQGVETEHQICPKQIATETPVPRPIYRIKEHRQVF